MGNFNDFFDDVVVNAKAAASAVSKKATEIKDVSKQKISAAEIRGEINNKLKDLGALTYKKETSGYDADEKIKKLVDEITEMKENLNVLNQSISSAKNQKVCPECQAAVSEKSAFCNFCGAKLDNENY